MSAHLPLSCVPTTCVPSPLPTIALPSIALPSIVLPAHVPLKCSPSLSAPSAPSPCPPSHRYGRKLRLLRRARLLTTVADAEAALAGARIKRLGVYAKATGVVYCAAPLAANASGLQVAICHVTYAGSRRSYFSRAEQGSTRVSSVPFQLALPDGRLAVCFGLLPAGGAVVAANDVLPTTHASTAPLPTPHPPAAPPSSPALIRHRRWTTRAPSWSSWKRSLDVSRWCTRRCWPSGSPSSWWAFCPPAAATTMRLALAKGVVSVRQGVSSAPLVRGP